MKIRLFAATIPIILSLMGCSDPKPDSTSSNDNEEEAAPERSALSEFTPIPTESQFPTLTPRPLTEPQIDELIKGIKIELRGPGFRKVSFNLKYSAELNLNQGPSMTGATFEGTELELDLQSIVRKDGTTVQTAGKRSARSKKWVAEENQFHDSRGVELEEDIKKGTLDKVEGDIVLQLGVDIHGLEFTRPEELTPAIQSEEIPIEGLRVTPFWENRNVEIQFEAGSRNKIVHIRGIDEDGQELKITAIGGLDRRDNPEAGRHTYRFLDNGKKLQTIQFFAAPKVVERRVPFELQMAE